jgi:hypothetical protein
MFGWTTSIRCQRAALLVDPSATFAKKKLHRVDAVGDIEINTLSSIVVADT